jgi:hypothetical protein
MASGQEDLLAYLLSYSGAQRIARECAAQPGSSARQVREVVREEPPSTDRRCDTEAQEAGPRHGAADRNPGAVRRGAAGRWFITPHAVRRYIERVRPGIAYERALSDLVRLSVKAHHVKAIEGGAELWRGPKPRRLRFIVAQGMAGKPQLVTVLFAFDRSQDAADR